MDRWEWLGVVTAALVLYDWAMSVPRWGLESNPLAIELGIWPILFAKVVVVYVLLRLWFSNDGLRDYWAARGLMVTIFGLHVVVVVTNVIVILAL